jgi:hypothetical protein
VLAIALHIQNQLAILGLIHASVKFTKTAVTTKRSKGRRKQSTLFGLGHNPRFGLNVLGTACIVA